MPGPAKMNGGITSVNLKYNRSIINNCNTGGGVTQQHFKTTDQHQHPHYHQPYLIQVY